ncbi:small kinetochore-associated protein [Mantella aurantiaca]
MERSKLPVLRHEILKSSDPFLPNAKKPCPPKPVLPLYRNRPNIAFSSTIPEFTMNKGGGNGKKTVPSKKSVPLTRVPVYQQTMESKLRDQNQLLEAANSTLNDRLQTAQTTIQEMSEKQETVQEELKGLRKRLEKNLVILEGRNIDPVSGEQILANAEETCKVKEETKTAAENLLKELRQFISITKEQQRLVQTIKAKWIETEENRNQFLEEQKSFQVDLDKFKACLEQTEKWLDL